MTVLHAGQRFLEEGETADVAGNGPRQPSPYIRRRVCWRRTTAGADRAGRGRCGPVPPALSRKPMVGKRTGWTGLGPQRGRHDRYPAPPTGQPELRPTQSIPGCFAGLRAARGDQGRVDPSPCRAASVLGPGSASPGLRQDHAGTIGWCGCLRPTSGRHSVRTRRRDSARINEAEMRPAARPASR